MADSYYSDEHVTLYHGDAVATLAEMESGSVDCIVTSPPYFGLRDYGVDGQIGGEPSPAEFVEALVAVFREARRVLADDGTLWLNLGDSYATHDPGGYRQGEHLNPGGRQAKKGSGRNRAGTRAPGLTPKNMLGIPWRVAFALQDDGWILRNDIIWSKPNAMPESVTDRLSNRHEHLFMFSKSKRYWFDLDPIREPHEWTQRRITPPRQAVSGVDAGRVRNRPDLYDERLAVEAGPAGHELGKNPGDVWSIPTVPFPGAHFAVFPPALAERCIQAGCKPGGTVLDPFSGSGTTGMAAAKHSRRYVGIDLNADYLDLSLKTRLQQPGLDFASLTQEPAS